MGERIEYELTEAEAALLLAATQDSMAAAGAHGGSFVPAVDSLGTKRGGAAGGRLGARLFTRPHTAAAVIEVAAAPDVALELVRRSIEEHGRVIDDPNGSGDGGLWGLVRTGAEHPMPALVRAAAEPSAGGARLHVRATGREGLIKQRIGAKAVDRICDAVTFGTG